MLNKTTSHTALNPFNRLAKGTAFLALLLLLLYRQVSPVHPEPVMPTISSSIGATVITLPVPLANSSGSFCTWGFCSLSPRLYHEPLANNNSLVGWTDVNGSGHVSLILNGTIAETHDFPGTEIRGLAVHHHGGFGVLLWDAAADTLWLARHHADGSEVWRTNLNSTIAVADFRMGDGRLSYGNGRYLAYFSVRGVSGTFDGHHGDQLTYVDDSGNILPGGWEWGSSHALAQLTSYHPRLDQFMAVSVSDCYPEKGVRTQSSTIYQSDADCGGYVSAQLGQIALGRHDWKLVFNAQDSSCCAGHGIGLATIDAAHQSSIIWLTQTAGEDEQDPVITHLGRPNQPEQYLVGWHDSGDNTYWLGIIDRHGQFVQGPENVTASGAAWGNRDDTFRTRPDGRIAWVHGEPSSTTLYLYHFSQTGGAHQLFLPMLVRN